MKRTQPVGLSEIRATAVTVSLCMSRLGPILEKLEHREIGSHIVVTYFLSEVLDLFFRGNLFHEIVPFELLVWCLQLYRKGDLFSMLF